MLVSRSLAGAAVLYMFITSGNRVEEGGSRGMDRLFVSMSYKINNPAALAAYAVPVSRHSIRVPYKSRMLAM